MNLKQLIPLFAVAVFFVAAANPKPILISGHHPTTGRGSFFVTALERREARSMGTAGVINCSRCPPKSCRIRKARCDRTRSRHQAALHPVGEGLARGSTAGQTVGGGLQRFVAKGFVAKGKLAGSTLWGAVPINRPCRVLCAFDLREPLNLPILAV